MDEYVNKWIKKADNDLKVASNELSLSTEYMVTEAICFHSQQAAEKLLKAYLIALGIDFDRTHNIEYLIKLCSSKDKDFIDLDAGNLTSYAVNIRYPDSFSIPDIEEAQESYKTAVRIRIMVLEKLESL